MDMVRKKRPVSLKILETLYEIASDFDMIGIYFDRSYAYNILARKEYLARKKMYAQRQIKNSLYYLKKKGYIKTRVNKILVTKVGIERIYQQAKEYQNKIEKIKKWDGVWRVLIFDVPEVYRKQRDILRSIVKRFSFYPCQKSVWVSAYPVTEEIKDILQTAQLEEYCIFFEVRSIIVGNPTFQKILQSYFFYDRKKSKTAIFM